MAAERLQVILELVTGQYKKEAREAASSTKAIGGEAAKSGTAFSRLGKEADSLKSKFLGGLGLVAMVGFLKSASQAAGEDDKSQRLLALAIENTTDSTQAQIDKNEQWIDGMARGTGVADDQLRPALANLVRTHEDLDTAQDDLVVALDISAAKGLDVETVAKAMAKAHDGNTGALKKLGLQVQDTEGNLLTYEEVLAKASETMGGAAGEAAASLAGQLERQKVAAEESAEAFGAKVIPVQSHWQGLLGVLISELGPATEQSIARMNLQFNDLVNSGVDPASDKMASFITILASSEDTASATEGSLEMLSAMVGITADQFGAAARYIEDNADALGLNADEVANLTGLLDPETTALQRLNDEWQTHADVLLDSVAATREQIDATRELVDPLFALEKATDRATEAEADYNEAVRLHGDYSKEAYDASLTLAGAQLDLNAASATWAEEGGAGSLQVLRDTLEQAGLMPDVIQDIIDRWKTYNDTPVNAKYPVVFDPKTGKPVLTPIAGVFHEGGVVPGGQNDEVLILAKGGERVIPNNMLIPPGGQGRLDGGGMAAARTQGQSLQVHIHYPNHTGNDIQAAIQRAVGLAGLVHFAEVTSGES